MLQVDKAFLADFAALSTFGALPSGGLERQTCSPADGEARQWLASWFSANGFEVRHDAVGNLFGLLTTDPDKPYVLLGSHLDSQPRGGRFDGQYGVLAAAHAARRLADSASGNLAVVDWVNEEGARFQPSVMGSSVFIGALALADARASVDADGVSFGDALDDLGMPEEASPLGPDFQVTAYAEIHVEQGRHLDDTGINVAVVDACWAAAKLTIEVTGEQTHTGPTAMNDRRDALLGASQVIVGLRELNRVVGDDVLHTSVAWMQLEPNSPNVVPSRVVLKAELRSADEALLAEAVARFKHTVCSAAGEASATMVTIVSSSLRKARTSWPRGLELAEAVAAEQNITICRRPTIAGHDAIVMATAYPSVLLFIPSVDGITHNEREFTRDDDLLRGVRMLAGLAARLLEE